MRFLRMLTNSLLAGALGASYLTILLLQLNPHVPIVSETTWRWFAAFGIFYGVHLAVLFYVLMMAREFFSLEPMSPGWASVRVLAWLAAALAAASSALMWLNVRGFESALGEAATRRMTAGAAAVSASAVVLLGIAIAHYSFGRRGSRVGASLFAMAAFGSLALPLAARGPAAVRSTPPSAPVRVVAEDVSGRRVIMLLLDGAALEYIWPEAAAGRLPNFATLLDSGAMLDLATVRPTGPGPVWASAATGLYPSRTGIRSGAHYAAWGAPPSIDLLPDGCFSHALVHFGAARQLPSASNAWLARPIWRILSDAGIDVGLVRWPLTYPAPAVAGFVVSDRYHELIGSIMELDGAVVYPSTILPVVRAVFPEHVEDNAMSVVRAADERSPPGESPDVQAHRRDAAYSRTMRELRARTGVRFLALRYQGLDTIGHYYMGDTEPAVVAGTDDHERRQHLQVLGRYYTYIDAEIGAALASLAPEDLLLVISGFGMRRQNPLKQIAGRLLGDPDLTGTHAGAPDGFLLAYGADVESGRHQRGSIVDVAPTVLYYLGLPVGRDMDGYARADIFTREFTAERPITYIASYNK